MIRKKSSSLMASALARTASSSELLAAKAWATAVAALLSLQRSGILLYSHTCMATTLPDCAASKRALSTVSLASISARSTSSANFGSAFIRLTTVHGLMPIERAEACRLPPCLSRSR